MLKLTPTEFAQAIGGNAWRWDLPEFARRLGRDPQHCYTQELFTKLHKLANALSAFDAPTLEILATPAEVPAEKVLDSLTADLGWEG